MRTRAVAPLVATLVLTACGSSSDGPNGDGTDEPAFDAPWRTSSQPIATDGLAWAGGSTVHLPDGTTVDLGRPPKAFVVAGDGVFFLAADGEDDVGRPDISVRELQFASTAGPPIDTGVELQADTLAASPDGRYVGGLDMVSGEQDQFGTPLATARVFDLQTGEEVLRSDEGMGEPGEDDVAVLYEDTSIGLRLRDGVALVDQARGDWRAHDLATGGSEAVPEGEQPRDLDEDTFQDSPDGDWTIVERPSGAVLRSRDGTSVRPRTGTRTWTLDGWIDDSTVVGTAAPGRADGVATLMTCVVPSGDCRLEEDSTGQLVVLPQGATWLHVLDLREGRGTT